MRGDASIFVQITVNVQQCMCTTNMYMYIELLIYEVHVRTINLPWLEETILVQRLPA